MGYDWGRVISVFRRKGMTLHPDIETILYELEPDAVYFDARGRITQSSMRHIRRHPEGYISLKVENSKTKLEARRIPDTPYHTLVLAKNTDAIREGKDVRDPEVLELLKRLYAKEDR